MRKHMKKLVSMCVVFAVVVSCMAMSASAITWDNVEETNYAYYRDPYGPSSSYSGSKFYTNLHQIPLTGDGRRDSVAVAASQMGYLEGDSGDQSGEYGGSGNYTEFGDYMGITGYAWCAAFCSWVYYNAQVTDLYGYSDSCGNNPDVYGYWWSDTYVPNWSNQLNDYGMYEYSYYYGGDYIPQPGDLVFFPAGYTPLDEGHIGMVAFCDGSYVYTMEGNTSSQDGVEADGGGAFFKKYAIGSSSLGGYGVMPFNTRSDLPELDYTGANPTPGLYVTVSGAVGVYLDKDDSTASWTLPMSSVFEVTKIEEDSSGYTMLYSKCEISGTTVYGWIPLGNTSNGLTRTFQIYASEEQPGIESDVYEVTDDNKVKGVSVNTTVSQFLNNITSEGEVKLYNGNTQLSSTAKLGTGMEIDVVVDGTVVDTYTIVVKGDVNGDTKVNGFDYVLLKRHILKTRTLEGAYYDAGAVINGKKISAFDYIMIKRYVLGDVSF